MTKPHCRASGDKAKGTADNVKSDDEAEDKQQDDKDGDDEAKKGDEESQAPRAKADGGEKGGEKRASPPSNKKKTVLEAFGYQVQRTLGHGTYASVKAAYSTTMKKTVAIKVIKKNQAPKDYLEKFLPREISLIKDLNHPNLVLFMQSIETTNRMYLVMEVADGGDLLGVMNKNQYIKEPQAGIWFGQMVDCIAYIHSKGIVHRDLKCENVLLDSKNNIKVTDFGFARSGLIRPDGSIAFSQTYCGSYSYAAPEILTGTPYNPFKSDIWSLGVILFIMVFGRFPFDDTTHKTLLKQVQSEVKFPSDRTWVSEDCKALLRKIFQRPDTRITFEDMRKDAWYRRSCVSKKE